jgi:hypothetical protein
LAKNFLRDAGLPAGVSNQLMTKLKMQPLVINSNCFEAFREGLSLVEEIFDQIIQVGHRAI